MARTKRQPEAVERPALPREERSQDVLRGRAAPDVPDVRAKNSGHRKKTADKWNQ